MGNQPSLTSNLVQQQASGGIRHATKLSSRRGPSPNPLEAQRQSIPLRPESSRRYADGVASLDRQQFETPREPRSVPVGKSPHRPRPTLRLSCIAPFSEQESTHHRTPSHASSSTFRPRAGRLIAKKAPSRHGLGGLAPGRGSGLGQDLGLSLGLGSLAASALSLAERGPSNSRRRSLDSLASDDEFHSCRGSPLNGPDSREEGFLWNDFDALCPLGAPASVEDLPTEVLHRVLAHLPRSSWAAARGTCKTWREQVGCTDVVCQRRVEGLQEPWAIVVEWKFQGFKNLVPVLRAFDPTMDRWYTLGCLPRMAGVNHTSTMVAMGEDVLFLGGTVTQEDGKGSVTILPGASVWSYNLFTGKTERLPDMIQGRIHCAAAQIGGKIIVAGGTGKADEPLRSVEEFDPELNQWRPLLDLQSFRGKCYGSEVGGRFWVFPKGAELHPRPSGEVYDPAMGMWVSVQGMPKNMGPKVRFELVGNEFVLTKDVRPCRGCGTTEKVKLKGNLSRGNQLMWCNSLL